MSEPSSLKNIITSELQKLVRDGHAERDEDGIYELTQAGWEFFQRSHRIPFPLTKDTDAILVPTDLMEVFTLLLEGLIFSGLNPQTMLREQAQRVSLPTGRLLRLRADLAELINEIAEFYQANERQNQSST